MVELDLEAHRDRLDVWLREYTLRSPDNIRLPPEPGAVSAMLYNLAALIDEVAGLRRVIAVYEEDDG